MAVAKRILIVEDDPQFVRILTRLLRPWNPEISSCASGAEAIRLLDRGAFDLVTVDLQLAGGDGFQLLDSIASRSETVVSACVIVTGFPIIGKAMSDLPVVSKTNLVELGPHLLRRLGRPPETRMSVQP